MRAILLAVAVVLTACVGEIVGPPEGCEELPPQGSIGSVECSDPSAVPFVCSQAPSYCSCAPSGACCCNL